MRLKDVDQTSDPRFDLPLYSVPEAARLSGLRPRTLWNWLRGYRYQAGGKLVRAKPVVRPTTDGSSMALSFVNLVEARALMGFRQTGVSMQRVRKALDYVGSQLHIDHPLASERILSDGIDLFWEYQEKSDEELQVINISRGGQKAFLEAVMRYLREMEWGPDQIVTRWWPGSRRAGEGEVVVDPRRAFGAPVVAGTGIRTEDIFQRFSAGDPVETLARDYGLTVAKTEAAIRAEARFLEPIVA